MRVPDPSVAPNRAEGRRAIKALRSPALLSLIPWAAFIVAVAIADAVLDESGNLASLLAVSPFYLGFVALPCFLPIAAARAQLLRIAVVVSMTGVAAAVGVQMVASDSSTAGLAVLIISYVAIPLALVLWFGHMVVAAGNRQTMPAGHLGTRVAASTADRLIALGIDAALVIGALIVPLTMLSNSKNEVAAAALGLGVGASYLAVAVAWWGRTVGHLLLGIHVVDAKTFEKIGLGRALARGVIVTLVVVTAPTVILSLPACLEIMSVASSGRSLTDRFLKMMVLERTYVERE